MAMYVEEQLRKFIDPCECLFPHFGESTDILSQWRLFIRMVFEDMTAKEDLLTSLL